MNTSLKRSRWPRSVPGEIIRHTIARREHDPLRREVAVVNIYAVEAAIRTLIAEYFSIKCEFSVSEQNRIPGGLVRATFLDLNPTCRHNTSGLVVGGLAPGAFVVPAVETSPHTLSSSHPTYVVLIDVRLPHDELQVVRAVPQAALGSRKARLRRCGATQAGLNHVVNAVNLIITNSRPGNSSRDDLQIGRRVIEVEVRELLEVVEANYKIPMFVRNKQENPICLARLNISESPFLSSSIKPSHSHSNRLPKHIATQITHHHPAA
ncbi:hypothetical protein BC938DRAFT_477217 [Jimgerdemannia flammicorona]|uniref:Uncharacterized protein n=1 Tax=Jimgerdemannia flammicorona TaxID=994334 RepID=A0A433QPP3_9FUNG|nr:hypothetical protein BC938DRAFT_477217 [Jimgerdemannia flammicorona]